MRRALLIWTFAFVLASGAAALADDPIAPGAEAAIQDVISKQLDAFKVEDGAAAEAFAAPGIKTMFPSPDMFMGMVKNAYSALIRPRSTHFDALNQTPLGLVQKMTIIDGNGQVWTAAYTMMLVDGQWKISGCFILKSDAVNA